MSPRRLQIAIAKRGGAMRAENRTVIIQKGEDAD
jgi:hypothetical protein